jgi:serine/threonine-protein kinase
MSADSDDKHPAFQSTLHASRIEAYCPSCDKSYAEDAMTCPDDGTRLVRLAERGDDLIGADIDGRFTIESKLGSGGMGSVYRAFQHSMGRHVAIKVITPRLSHDVVAAKRFLREAKLTSRLSQPNTVTVLDFGQTAKGALYLVMELLKGRTLSALLTDSGPMPVERIARIGVQVGDALDAAHALDIIHRDLKPSNILVLDDPPGRDLIKVLDFGLAKSLAADETTTEMTHSDMLLGTPNYMPPELCTGQGSDSRSDLYSFGVILYEMLSGALPFKAETVNSLLTQHAYDPPAPLGDEYPAPLRELIMKMLAKQRDDRPQTAAEVRTALMKLTSRRSGDTAAPPVGPRTASPEADTHVAPSSTPAMAAAAPAPARSRAPIMAAIAIAVFGLAIAGGYFALRDRGDATPAPTAATATPDAAPTPAITVDAAAVPAAAAEPPDAAPASEPKPDRRKPKRKRRPKKPDRDPSEDFVKPAGAEDFIDPS